MKFILHRMLILFAALSVLFLLSAPALAQDADTIYDAAESWDDNTAVHVTFEGDTVNIQGEGAALQNGVLTISKAGTYVLYGAWDNGQVCIDAGKDDVVRLVLNGVSIRSPSSTAMYAKQAGKVIITLVKDTENSLEDGGDHVLPDGDANPDAALYVQDSLCINGRGTLLVIANVKHGIVSKDDLMITGGILVVKAADVGIRGRDSLEISGGEITVNAKGDALQANNADDPGKGFILLSGGKYHLTSGKDGIQAESSLTISSGDYTLYTGGVTNTPGDINPHTWQPDGTSQDAAGKGLKAGTSIYLSGGTFSLFCADDAVNAKGDILIENSILKIAARDDGIHADGLVTIEGGKLVIQTSIQ